MSEHRARNVRESVSISDEPEFLACRRIIRDRAKCARAHELRACRGPDNQRSRVRHSGRPVFLPYILPVFLSKATTNWMSCRRSLRSADSQRELANLPAHGPENISVPGAPHDGAISSQSTLFHTSRNARKRGRLRRSPKAKRRSFSRGRKRLSKPEHFNILSGSCRVSASIARTRSDRSPSVAVVSQISLSTMIGDDHLCPAAGTFQRTFSVSLQVRRKTRFRRVSVTFRAAKLRPVCRTTGFDVERGNERGGTRQYYRARWQACSREAHIVMIAITQMSFTRFACR